MNATTQRALPGIRSQDLLVRHLVYRDANSRHYLCVCAARDRRHALRIARQMFHLPRTAHAIPFNEPGEIPAWR